MNDNLQKCFSMNYSELLNRILGGACGMAAGFACGVHINDEFLTFALGIMGAFLGLGAGFVRTLVVALAVVVGVNLYML